MINRKISCGGDSMVKKRKEEYFLMHKDIPVCVMEISEDGTLENYRKNMSASEHFPIGGQMNALKREKAYAFSLNRLTNKTFLFNLFANFLTKVSKIDTVKMKQKPNAIYSFWFDARRTL